MKAVVIVRTDGRGRLEPREIPEPPIRPGTVRIQVHAAGVNHADLAQRDGRYSQHATHAGAPPAVAGLEVAGVVTEVAADVTGVRVGDEVMTMCAGGYAEQVVVDHRLVLRKPDWLGWAEAAAVPVGHITAHNALTEAGRVATGESVLVTGATSIVGTASGQLARHLGAGRVLGTAGGPEKAALARERGFDVVIDYRSEDLGEALARAGGVDVVIDLVAGEWLPALLDALNVRGRLVSVGRLGGKQVAFDLDVVARKRLSVVGVSFRTRTIDEYAVVVRRMAADVEGPLRRRELNLPSVRVFPLAEAAAAQDFLANGAFAGKVVLTIT